jgi:phosphoribosyl 1,2-cyclic phosphate phosphodiesterase
MTYRLTFLGTGSSGGVPRIGNQWGACDPSEPRNRRRRCAVLVERFSKAGKTVVLVDTPPDLRDQLLSERVEHLDAVLFTHDHADHTHGIDELRVLAFLMKRRIDVYFDAATRESLVSRFDYCFLQRPGSTYPAILTPRDLAAGVPVTIMGAGGPITATPILQDHGEMPSLGFRFGRLVYSPDIVGAPETSHALFQGLDIMIVDALRPVPHPSHFSLSQALAWIEKFQPKRAILTHMHIDLDYRALKRELPANVEPAYDGLQIEFEG